jgi:hypothetical protein
VAYLLKTGIVKPGETAIARQPLCKHATVPETSISNVCMQQWRNCWKRCFLCCPCVGYMSQSAVVSWFRVVLCGGGVNHSVA